MRNATLFAGLAVSTLIAATSSAQASVRIEAGTLNCTLEDRTNIVIYSDAVYTCTLRAAGDWLTDGVYRGEIKRYGVDLDWKAEEILSWTVLVLVDQKWDGPIEGDYAGVGADVALGLGIGANVLLGGLDNNFGLQPLSLEGQEGFGAAAGVEHFLLTYVGDILN